VCFWVFLGVYVCFCVFLCVSISAFESFDRFVQNLCLPMMPPTCC
jgi:hypothetical protein